MGLSKNSNSPICLDDIIFRPGLRKFRRKSRNFNFKNSGFISKFTISVDLTKNLQKSYEISLGENSPNYHTVTVYTVEIMEIYSHAFLAKIS